MVLPLILLVHEEINKGVVFIRIPYAILKHTISYNTNTVTLKSSVFIQTCFGLIVSLPPSTCSVCRLLNTKRQQPLMTFVVQFRFGISIKWTKWALVGPHFGNSQITNHYYPLNTPPLLLFFCA